MHRQVRYLAVQQRLAMGAFRILKGRTLRRQPPLELAALPRQNTSMIVDKVKGACARINLSFSFQARALSPKPPPMLYSWQ